MTLLRYFFSASGRFKRLTFWEGLVAWVLLNIIVLIIEVAILSCPIDDYLVQGIGDVDHVVYNFLAIGMLFLHWVVAIWSLVAISAKRWHDLNCPGWLAVINIMPVVFLGLAVLIYLDSLGLMFNYSTLRVQDSIRCLVTDTHANIFALFSQAYRDYNVNFRDTHLLTSVFWLTILYGSSFYISFFKGNTGANDYGKQSI
jgi:uncharacterized membrane protein YhaH (DUF805 family)